jgi:predicted PurR-regulated permease PerM
VVGPARDDAPRAPSGAAATANGLNTGPASPSRDQAGDGPAGAATDRAPSAARRGRRTQSAMLTGLFLIALLWAMHFARPVLVPMVLAAVLAIVLTPPVRWLHSRGVPSLVSASIILVAGLGLLFAGIYFVSGPAIDWAQRLPEIARGLEEKTRHLRDSVAEVEEVSNQVGQIVDGESEPDPGTLEVVVRDDKAVGRVFVLEFGNVLIGTALVVVIAFFLLASGDSFLRKLVEMIPRLRHKVQAVAIVREIQHEISLYFSTITIVNIGLGAATGVAMWLMGLPNALLWGIMAGLFNFVPYLGALAGTAIIGMVASAEFDTLPRIFWTMGVYYALTVAESNLVTPFVLGRRMTLNPVVVFASVLFWGWLWGLPGVFLAIPILAIIKIIGDRVASLTPVAQFLSK